MTAEKKQAALDGGGQARVTEVNGQDTLQALPSSTPALDEPLESALLGLARSAARHAMVRHHVHTSMQWMRLLRSLHGPRGGSA